MTPFPLPKPLSGKRTDTHAIKQKMADLLSPEQGELYWDAFGSFLTGKTTREEFERATKDVLEGPLTDLHDSLVLAILFNTTVSANAPLAERHSGWYPKRKRDAAEGTDPKRRRLKDSVLALPRKERNRIKAFAGQSIPPLSRPPFHPIDKSTMRPPGIPDVLKVAGKPPTAAFQQDYARCQQAQICSETHTLPDPDTLKDRMSYVAYNHSLQAGADAGSADVLLIALELHLKNIISAAQSIKQNQPKPPSAPLSLADMEDLARVDRAVFGRPFIGALERHLGVSQGALEDMSGTMTEQEAQISATAGHHKRPEKPAKEQDKQPWGGDLVNPVQLLNTILSRP